MVQDLFLNATILITFITIANQIITHRNFNVNQSIKFKTAFGIGNGILGCILMSNSVTILPNIILDFRNIAIILSSIYGGIISSIITGLLIGLFRILYFGLTTSSIAAFIVAVLTSVITGFISKKEKSLLKKWLYACLIGVILGTIAYIILINDIKLLMVLILAFWIGSFMVVLFLYKYINNLTESNKLFIKYKEESTKDFLTGLNNVRQFDMIYNNLTKKLNNREEHLSLLFIDIDHFKRVNDTYGHTEGDLILKQLSEILISTCRDFDIVSRNGGEEFSVMLLDCMPEQAKIIAERIRVTVEKHEFLLSKGNSIGITISIGIATYPDTTSNFNKLIDEADKALYKAKQTGRNRVVFKEK